MARFGFSLRTACPEAISQACIDYDQVVDGMLAHLFHSGLDSKRRALVGLPVRMGGLGIPRAQDTAWSAYVGSISDTMDVQKLLVRGEDWSDSYLEDALHSWNSIHSAAGGSVSSSDLVDIRSIQHSLTNRVHNHVQSLLSNDEEAVFRATVLGCKMADSGKWTDVFPDSFSNLTMSREAFGYALRSRLGLPLFNKVSKCENCKSNVDIRGQHLASCPGIHARAHDEVRDELFKAASRAHLRPSKEPLGLLGKLCERNQERPADVFLPAYRQGKGLCVDVTIVNSFSNIQDSATTLGYNAERAAQAKRGRYQKELENHGMLFSPFAIESLGGFHADCTEILTYIGSALSHVESGSSENITSRLKTRLNFVWQRALGQALASQAAFSST